MYKSLFLAIVFSVVVMGCSASQDAPVASSGMQKPSLSLEGPKWKLVSFGLTRMAVPQKAFITFKDGQYSGHAGCNGLGGNYKAENYAISFEAGFSTMMACPELDLEHKYVKAISRVDSYEIDGDILDLQSEGHSLLRFKAQ